MHPFSPRPYGIIKQGKMTQLIVKRSSTDSKQFSAPCFPGTEQNSHHLYRLTLLVTSIRISPERAAREIRPLTWWNVLVPSYIHLFNFLHNSSPFKQTQTAQYLVGLLCIHGLHICWSKPFTSNEIHSCSNWAEIRFLDHGDWIVDNMFILGWFSFFGEAKDTVLLNAIAKWFNLCSMTTCTSSSVDGRIVGRFFFVQLWLCVLVRLTICV